MCWKLLISDDRHQRLRERCFCFVDRLISGCQFYSIDSMNFNLEYQQGSHIDSKVSMERPETQNNPYNVKTKKIGAIVMSHYKAKERHVLSLLQNTETE